MLHEVVVPEGRSRFALNDWTVNLSATARWVSTLPASTSRSSLSADLGRGRVSGDYCTFTTLAVRWLVLRVRHLWCFFLQ